MKRIIIVEDDTIIATGLVYALEQENYLVTHQKSIKEALHAIGDNSDENNEGNGSSDGNVKFDLALLDMQFPDGTGFDLCEKLKKSGTAIIFLTVVDDEGNLIRAFESGADDYIVKPFRLRELLARIKRTLNAHNKSAPMPLMSIGRVTIDTAAGKAYLDEKLLDLTALEYRLLLTFATNRGQMLSRTQILENIWDSTGNFVEDNTLTVYIKRLREKLGTAVTIETLRGMGYRVD